MNSDLVMAFPGSVRHDAIAVVSTLPENPRPFEAFSLTVGGEEVSIPQRIYHNPPAMKLERPSRIQKELFDCLFTRHFDGFTRQQRLLGIVRSESLWVPPFVVRLAGEYVVEILRVIEQALPELDLSVYAAFLRANPSFLALTERRIASYWNCYYRSFRPEEYAGFRILEFLKSAAADKPSPPGNISSTVKS